MPNPQRTLFVQGSLHARHPHVAAGEEAPGDTHMGDGGQQWGCKVVTTGRPHNYLLQDIVGRAGDGAQKTATGGSTGT